MANPILSLEAISKQFAEHPLLAEVSLAVAAGERIGVVGVNGSGKTTLLRIVAGVEPPDSGRLSMARDLRLAYLPQNPALDPALSVLEQVFQGDVPTMQLLRRYEQVATALASAPDASQLQHEHTALIEAMDSAGAWGIEHEARSILTELGVADLQARVGNLSGGQRKRVALATTLIATTDLLILDEPTNQIDTTTVAWLEAYLARATSALLLVTHDRYFLDRVCQRIVEVDGAKLYSYPGAYSRFLELKSERLAQQASDEARRQTILKRELTWLRRGAQARTTKQQARIDRISVLQAATPSAARAPLEISSLTRRLGKKVIELAAVNKGYGARQLIKNLTLSIGARSRLGIIGPNGSGKTTLLNLIAGRTNPDSGVIDVGETVQIAYYDQESAGLDESQRVIEYVKQAAELVQTATGQLISAAQLLEQFLFPAAMHYSLIAKLSGGERRRLYLLRTLMRAPNVLLLDEPTNDLDIQTLEVLEDYLDDFAGALVVVSHDRYFLDRTVEQMLAFEDGTINAYPGGYSSYAERVAERRATPAPAAARQPQPGSAPTGKARKLSFSQARELRALEGQIAALEARQAELGAQINATGSDYQALQRLSGELAELETSLETAVERWAELAELAEGRA